MILSPFLISLLLIFNRLPAGVHPLVLDEGHGHGVAQQVGAPVLHHEHERVVALELAHVLRVHLGLLLQLKRTCNIKGPSTLATLFNHMWPRIVADPSTLGRHVAATCMLCMQTLCLWRGRATACRPLGPQTAVCSPKRENNGFLRE